MVNCSNYLFTLKLWIFILVWICLSDTQGAFLMICLIHHWLALYFQSFLSFRGSCRLWWNQAEPAHIFHIANWSIKIANTQGLFCLHRTKAKKSVTWLSVCLSFQIYNYCIFILLFCITECSSLKWKNSKDTTAMPKLTIYHT